MAEEKILSIKIQTEAQTKDIAALQTRLVQLTQQRNELNKKIREGKTLTDLEKQSLGQLQPELVATRNKLRDLEREVVKNNDALKKNSGFVAGVRKGMKQALSSFTAFAAGAIAVGAAVRDAFNTIKEFEQSLAELGSITGLQGQELANLGQKAIDLSKKFGTSAKDILDGFKLVGSASPELLENADALAEVTKQAEILAKAGGLTLPEAADALTKSMNQFGLSAEESAMATDVLATSQQKGTATIQQLSESLKNVGSVARASGLSFEDTNAALQALAKGGSVGAEAGTQLRGVLLKLAQTGRDELNPATQEMGDILDVLSKEVTDVTKASKLFGAENAAAALTLIAQRDVVNNLNGSLNETGNALKQAEQNTDTLAGNTAKLGKAWDNFILSVINGESDLSKIINGSIKLLTALVNDVTFAFKSAKAIIEEVRNANLSENIKNAIKEAEELGEKINNQQRALELTIESYEKLGNQKEVVEALKRKLDGLNKTTEESTEITKEEAKAIKESNKERDKVPPKMETIEDKRKKENDLIREYIQLLKDQGIISKKTLEETQSDLNKQLDARYKANEKLQKQNRQQQDEDAKAAIEKQQAIDAAKQEAIKGALDGLSDLSNQYFAREQRKLERASNAETALLKEKYNKNEISEKQYRQEIDKILEAQFEKEKRMAIIQNTLNSAVAFMKSAATYGWTPALGVAGAALGVSLIAQNAVVSSQKYEPIEFAEGGLLQGRSHAQGGIPMTINGQAGFEAEGGEAIINKKSTSMFLPLLSQINQAGGGVAFDKPASLRKFAVGGLTPTNITPNQDIFNLMSSINSRIDRIQVVNVASETAQVANRVNNIQSMAAFG